METYQRYDYTLDFVNALFSPRGAIQPIGSDVEMFLKAESSRRSCIAYR